MTDRESFVVLGVFVVLIGTTVIPFVLPAMQSSTEATATKTPTSAGDKVVPAGASLTPTVVEPRSTDTAPPTDTLAPTRQLTPVQSPQMTLAVTDLRCEPKSDKELSEEFPLAVGGAPITGEGVSVAVIEPSGFDVDDPRIAEEVEATKSFQSRGPDDITNGGANHHGTESAALVSRNAPDASLYLANFQKAIDFTRAVDWAIEENVDVIVAPTSFYAKPNDGSAPVSRAVTKATEEGIVVVVPTGNVAKHHWEGTYEDGPWLEFSPNETRMYLRGTDRPVRAWLWWNETAESGPNEFQVVLYKDLGGTSKRVATSQDYPKGPVGTNQVLFEKIRSNNLLSSSIGNGTYFLRIKGPEDVAHRVELVAAAHPLEEPVARGSIVSPATARGNVIAVGAARDSTGRALATSSRGPTNDGRPGIDLLAPGTVAGSSGATFTGTSAGTAYTGGIVALMAEVDPSLTPARAEAVLQATAGPATPADANLATGHGLVDPSSALDCLANTRSNQGN